MRQIYLLHFDRRFGHALHYLGSADNIPARLAHHGTAGGANLLWHVARAGITWELARVWEGDRYREAALKRQGGHSRKCPLCRPRIERKLQRLGTLPYGPRGVTGVT